MVTEPLSAFRQLPFMGVIRVNDEAMREHGYRMGDPNWTNLGQGQPEAGEMPGAPPRICSIEIPAQDHGYGPIEGTPECRQAIADYYKRTYNLDLGLENIALAPGGRAALTRIGAIMEKVRLGYFTPDYTAYEDLMTTFPRIEPVWLELTPEKGFMMSPADLEAHIKKENLGAVLISNPCNPTGAVLKGETLKGWLEVARRTNCVLIMDEFYSHYIYDGSDKPVSIAEFVVDIERDPVVIVDGLTKSFRYPGWRVGWVVAGSAVIRALCAAGSFLDGGPCRPIQQAAIKVLEQAQADQETKAVRAVFKRKRDLTIVALEAMGVEFPHAPQGTFYAFGYVGNLPAPLNTGLGFMRAAFTQKVLTVPGEFFDVNPNRQRTGESPLTPWVRFSFGPPEENLVAGLSRLRNLV
ncbi:MAG: pyridoxal phosphate-dependent aminotransferase [Fimbriimonadaceae bacterium]